MTRVSIQDAMSKATIVNTRPKNLQLETSQLFKDAGFDVVGLPCIEIVENNVQFIKDQLRSIQANDVVVFTSQFAVHYAFELFPDLKFIKSNTVIAVGKKSAETLEQNSSVAIWVPEKQNSEGVIELLKGLKEIPRIVLITAADGREELQKFAMMSKLGLLQIDVYKRIVPKVNKNIFQSIAGLNDFRTLATSVTTITNLKNMLPEKLWQSFLNNELLCASERIEAKAQELGFKKTMNVGSANIEKIIQALKKASI